MPVVNASTTTVPIVQSAFVVNPTPQPFMQSDVDVTVATVRHILDNHEHGDFYASAQLADRLDRNTRIRGALDSRVRALLGSESKVVAPEHAVGDPLTESITRKIGAWWHTVVNESVLEGMLRSHTTMGFSIAEQTWEVRRIGIKSTWMPVLHPWHCGWAGYNQARDGFYVSDAKGKHVPVVPGNGRWLMLNATAVYPWMRGVIRCVGLGDVLRGQAVCNWSRWAEKHGIPITKVSVPRNEVNAYATKRFMRDLRLMGRQGHIKLPTDEEGKKQFDVEFAEMKAKGWDGFQGLIGLTDTDVSIAILGQNLTSEVSGGSYAAAKVHDEVRLDLVKADAEMLSTCVRECVFKPWVKYNYGAHLVDLAPWPRWQVEPPANLEIASKVLASVMVAIEAAARTMAAGLPVPVDVRALLEEYEIPTTAVDAIAPVVKQLATATVPVAEGVEGG